MRAGKVKEVDVIVRAVHRMPSEFRSVDAYCLAILRYDRELIREMLLLDQRLHRTVRESISGNRFQQEPALNEAIRVGRLS